MAKIGDIYEVKINGVYSLFELTCCDILNDRIWILFTPLIPNYKFITTNISEHVNIDKELYESGFILTNITSEFKGKLIEMDDKKYVILGSDGKYLYCSDILDDINTYTIRKFKITDFYGEYLDEYIKSKDDEINKLKKQTSSLIIKSFFISLLFIFIIFIAIQILQGMIQ